MAKPVIIDDGGSIRIRQITDTKLGVMDGLLNSPPLDTTPDAFAVNLCFLTVRYNAENGSHHTVITPTGNPLQPGDLIAITSGTGQVTNITVGATAGGTNALIISIPNPAANAPGSPAQVCAMQDPATGRRRYIVNNAGTIAKVDYTPSGGACVNLFDAGTTPSIFTMVHFAKAAPIDLTAQERRESRRKAR